MGNLLIIVGAILILLGIIYKSGWLHWFGHLPGDIRIETEAVHVYIPLVSMIIISAVMSILLFIFKK